MKARFCSGKGDGPCTFPRGLDWNKLTVGSSDKDTLTGLSGLCHFSLQSALAQHWPKENLRVQETRWVLHRLFLWHNAPPCPLNEYPTLQENVTHVR